MKLSDKNEEITDTQLSELILQLKSSGIKASGIVVTKKQISIDWDSQKYTIYLSRQESKLLMYRVEKYLFNINVKGLERDYSTVLFDSENARNKLINMKPYFDNDCFGHGETMVSDLRHHSSKIYIV